MRLTREKLERMVRDVAARYGLEPEHEELFVRALVEAELRGIATHGIYRLPAYARAMELGEVNPKPQIREEVGGKATAVMDGDNGLGLVVAQLAMKSAIEKAREYGIGAVATRRSNHAGMLAVHVGHAAEAGMIGYAVANAPGLMAPYGGRDPLLSNAPFAYAIPTGDTPIIADMACSYVARGSIRLAAQRGDSIPDTWALDADGAPTTDAAAAMQGVLLPMAGHKGYALAVVNEILAAGLSGAALSMNMSRQFMRPEATYYDSWQAGQMVIAIDPEAFAGRETLQRISDELKDALYASEPSRGSDGVILPGDPERGRYEVALQEGVEISAPVQKALEDYSIEAGFGWFENDEEDR